MTFDGLMIHTVEITNPTDLVSDDIYGNPEYGTATVSSPAFVQFGSSNEDVIDRDTRITRFLVFMPPDAPVTGLSELTWETRTLKVDGEPRPFPTPRGNHHLELNAFEVRG